jgi:hypothetical protein
MNPTQSRFAVNTEKKTVFWNQGGMKGDHNVKN